MSDQGGLRPTDIGDRAYKVIPWIVAIAFFMQMLDTSILNTALPSIASDLHQNPLSMHWVIIAYMLTVAVLLPISGWLSDRYGTRNILFWAIALFSVGSLLCSLSSSLNQLIAARVVQGAGGAFMFPVGRLVVLRVYPRENLVRVLSMVSVPGMIGPLLGPTVGGFLVQYATWHWIFLINLPVGVLGMFAVWKLIPNLRRQVDGRFDLSGYLLFAAAMVMISFALDGMGHSSLAKWTAIALLVGGVVSLFLYWLHARRSPAPLFDLSIFKNRAFSVGLLGNIFARLSSGGMPYLTPILLQVMLGYSPSVAGLMMLPLSIMAMTAKPLATWLLGRFGYRPVLVLNTLLLGLCIASYSFFTPSTPMWVLLVGFSIFGAANSLQFTAMNTLALVDLDDSQTSSGNSLLSLVMQLSMSLGVAVASGLLAIFSPGTTAAVSGGQAAVSPGLIHAFQMSYRCLGLFCVVAAVIFLFTPKGLGKTNINK